MQTDIIIVGGGMVGSALALALAPLGLQITIFEKQPFTPPLANAPFSNRVSAITRSSENILRAIHAWEYIDSSRIASYDSMDVWEDSNHITFSAQEIGQTNLGYIIENDQILLALQQQLVTHDNITQIYGDNLVQLSQSDQQVTVTTTSGTTYCAKLLVATDGSNSWVRQQLATPVTAWNYHQDAIVATITTTKAHRFCAQQRFRSTGPIALLPLADPHTVSLVWSMDDQSSSALMQLSDDDFLQQLYQQFGDTLGGFTACTGRALFPLQLMHTHNYCSHRIVYAGNAAHTIHPLAGQGLNIGLTDIAALAQTIEEALQQQRDYGLTKTLRRYERWRKGENLAIMASMDLFKRLFGNPHPLVAKFRTSGLFVANKIPPLKRVFMRTALGVHSDSPRICQGLTTIY